MTSRAIVVSSSALALLYGSLACGGAGSSPTGDSTGAGAGGADASTGGTGGSVSVGGTSASKGGNTSVGGSPASVGGNGPGAGGAAGAGNSGGSAGKGASGSPAGTGGANTGGANTGGANTGGANTGGAAGSTTFGGGGSTSSGGTGGAGGGTQGTTLIYAHTNTDLFTLDPTSPTLAVTKVGAFDCIGGAGQDTSMTDIAVNSQDEVWAVSVKNVYKLAISGATVHCATTTPLKNATGVKFYGLTFAPVGVLGATEALVAGNTDGELWQIDAAGTLTLRGNLGTVPADDGHGHTYPAKNVGKPWELSGDIVFLFNGGDPVGFATVRDCPTPPSTTGCSKTDTLIQLDLTKLAAPSPGPVALAVRGQIVKGPTCKDTTTGTYGGMYGIAAWDKVVYGFSHTGDLVSVDTSDGSGCLVQSYPMSLWAGAGVTTLAPVHKP